MGWLMACPGSQNEPIAQLVLESATSDCNSLLSSLAQTVQILNNFQNEYMLRGGENEKEGKILFT